MPALQSSTIILLIIGILLVILGSVLYADALYVTGQYDGCTHAPGGNANNCSVNGFFGISAGGSVGNAFASAGMYVFGALLYLGIILTVIGAYRLGEE
jgi:hypothetical protein